MKYSNLDILKINSIFFSTKEKQPNLLMQIFIFIGQLFYYTFIIHFKYKNISTNYKGILFFGLSINNKRSLEPIINKMCESDCYIYLNNHQTDVHKRRAYWYSLPYIFTLLSIYRKSEPTTKIIIKKYFIQFLTTYGLYKIAGELLVHYKVKVLVMANDHNGIHRCLIYNAKKLNIKTVYVQHASVTNKFPKLNFSYSFLDGKESLEKYLVSGKPDGEIYLSGGVRFDYVYSKINKYNSGSFVVGIAINRLDDFEIVKKLCLLLINDNINSIILRPHPRYGKIDSLWLEKHNIKHSDPNEESSFDFISKINFMISNESSIHLDSAIMYCPSVLYNMSNNEILDYYSYLKNGLIKMAKNEQQVLNYIHNVNELLPSKELLQYYNASSHTSLEGKLGETISLFVELASENKENQFDKLTGFHINENNSIIHEINF